MFDRKNQKKEIETIRERTITVKMSDADCERLSRKCGENGLTVGELMENFIGDLVDGVYSNGSDECIYANQWFDRCWFGMFPEPTLLNHLLSWGYDPEDYINALDNIDTANEEKEYFAEHPEEADEEAQYLDDDIESWQEELKEMRADWNPEKEPDMGEEIDKIRNWVADREKFKYGNKSELSKQIYSHLCQCSSLKELFQNINISESVFRKEIRAALENDTIQKQERDKEKDNPETGYSMHGRGR